MVGRARTAAAGPCRAAPPVGVLLDGQQAAQRAHSLDLVPGVVYDLCAASLEKRNTQHTNVARVDVLVGKDDALHRRQLSNGNVVLRRAHRELELLRQVHVVRLSAYDGREAFEHRVRPGHILCGMSWSCNNFCISVSSSPMTPSISV